jgi:prolyl-tRNA synthetase
MRYSQALIPTLKEDPADAEAISHKLMVRAGLIRKLISGAYSYLPLGFKVLKKVEQIVRQEMDNAGAQEILMPALQPADLWHETGRYEVLGDELVKFKDRHGKEMVIGPTHEEVITDIARNELHSYKDLPKIIYQIQTKLRDEPRPRFGVIRSKEFIMKDAYSFDRDEKALDESYRKMFDAYHRIFKRCGLDVISVEADVGFMGGSESAEFMVLSESGEDIIAACKSCSYKGSLARTKALAPETEGAKTGRKTPKAEEVDTPGVTTIEKVSSLLKCKPQQMIKTLIYMADNKPIAVLVRGDHDVNEAKLQGLLRAEKLTLADEAVIQRATGGALGFSGPCGLKGIELLIDHAVAGIEDGITGANKKDKHLIHVMPGRDFSVDKTVDLRYVVEGDPCPKCRKPMALKRAIEVGHVFKLGTKYSKSMNARFLDSDGKEKPFIMGCYGIGINRIIAAAIEQNNDKDGISWPLPISPYQVIILSLNTEDKKVTEAAEDIYKQLTAEGVEVLFDDRPISAGIKFKDADLIGIPLQVIVGSKNIGKSAVELKARPRGEKKEVSLSGVGKEAKNSLDNLKPL